MPKTIVPKPGKLFDQGSNSNQRWLCLLGVALIIVSIYLIITIGWMTSRADRRLSGGLGGMGIAALTVTFSVRGFRFLPKGIQVWNYKYWLSGYDRIFSRDEIEAIHLKGSPGAHTASLRLTTGERIELCKKMPRFSEAEIWVGRISAKYEIPIENEVEEITRSK